MRDLEDRLPDALRDLSGDVVPDPSQEAPTLRRARRRRALTASATALALVAIVAGGLAGLRALAPSTTTTPGVDPTPSATSSPGPTDLVPLGAIWPETTAEDLAFAQQQIDEGHQPWRTDPAMTAEAFAVNVLGWAPEDVVSQAGTPGSDGTVAVEISNAGLEPSEGTSGPPAPRTVVTLAQLGRTDANGVWTVTGAQSELVALGLVEVSSDGTGLQVVGALSDPREEWTVAIDVYEGMTSDDAVTHVELGSDPEGFDADVAVASIDGSVIVVVYAYDPEGTIVAADAFGLLAPAAGVSAPEPTGTGEPPIEGLPEPVAATRQAILDGVAALDWDALAALIDPNTFVYAFDDGSDPIPVWREDPSVLDPIPAVLELPSVVQEIEGYGTFYVWPYLVGEGSLDEVSEQERTDLHALGLSDAQIEEMRAAGAYLGPRLAIDATGLWRNYVAGGD
ncbi:MAG TPA: hypothetical protein VID69_02400 [Actinomycetota bacterium]